MDAVFSLAWPEFIAAERLQALFPKTQGYSVYIPAARQEKDVDLALVRRAPGGGRSRVATIQVKASRTYLGEPPKRKTTERFSFYTWFNSFVVPNADFFMLIGFYPDSTHMTGKVSPKWYRDIILLLTHAEMSELISSCRTVRTGKADRYFGFGFDSPNRVIQTRGERGKDFTQALLATRADVLEQHLA